MHSFVNNLIAACLAVAVVFAPITANAQTASEPQAGGQLFDQEHRERIYDARKLTYGEATAWSLAFPGLGNYYVDQYLLGTLAIMSMVFAGFFVGYGVSTEQPDLLWTGVGIAAISYGWALGTALLGVRVYNAELRQNLHLDKPAPTNPAKPDGKTPGQTALQLSVQW
jgi:hypothetical protein